MRTFRLAFRVFLLFVFCLAFLWSSSTDADQREENGVAFRWAFGALVGSDGDQRLVAITRDTTLKTGDKLKMFVELKKKCFVYLIYRGAEDELYMLFPYDVNQFTSDFKPSKKYYIPQGGKWFELDENEGRETFYLLASDQRLIPLEALMEKYKTADIAKKPGLSKQILKEIRELKKKNRKFATLAERPVPIGGNLRGVKKDKELRSPDIDPIAAEVSAGNFYSRTFTIAHQ